MLERLPIGVIMFDTKQKRVVYVNNAARRSLHPVQLRRGQDLPEPWPHFSLSAFAERLVPPSNAFDERVEHGNGRVYVVSGIPPRDSSIATILIEDISDRDRRATAEREFVANAAHELLTPLTGIVGAAHVLQAGAKDVPQDRDHFIDHIVKECSRLTRIARSLLILARAQSGEELPRLEIITLSDVLEEVVDLINANVTIRGDQALTVFVDPDLFVQALANLIANAVQHGSDGEIVVEASAISEDLVEIDIIGTRPVGSDVAQFHKRFRSGAGRDGGGFGLGLSIAEQSLDAIGARLLLDGGSARVQLARGSRTE